MLLGFKEHGRFLLKFCLENTSLVTQYGQDFSTVAFRLFCMLIAIP